MKVKDDVFLLVTPKKTILIALLKVIQTDSRIEIAYK